MANNNNAELIDAVVEMLDRKIIELEYREKINVQMRIDDVIAFLKDVEDVAKNDQSSRKYDLTLDKTGNCTVAYTVNGVSASAGANVLKYGDKLVITVTASTGSTITKLKVNNKNYTSGTEIIVDTDVAVEVVSTLNTYTLAVTDDEHCTVAVTKGGVAVETGANKITYGDVLTITATVGEGYQIATLTVNGEAFTSGNTVTVSGNVTVVATSEAVENNG